MNAPHTQEIVEAGEPVKASASIISVIERAALNPDVDIDKMERLLEMQERIMARDAEAAFNVALAELQINLPAIVPLGEGHNKVMYAKWEHIQTQITPILADHGFALSFKTDTQSEKITVTAILRHREGHSDQTSLPLPADPSGSKNNVQAVGSSVSYGKRYTATALLNLNVAGEDDDGGAGGAGELISDEQTKELLSLIDQAEADTVNFCKYMKVGAIANMPVGKFETAKSALNKKIEDKKNG